MILTWWLMPCHQEISGWGISAFWDAMPSVNDKVVPKSSPGSLSPDPLDAGNCWKLSHNYPAWDMVKLVGQGRGYCCHSSNWWGRRPRRDLLKEKVEWSRPCSLTKVDKEPREAGASSEWDSPATNLSQRRQVSFTLEEGSRIQSYGGGPAGTQRLSKVHGLAGTQTVSSDQRVSLHFLTPWILTEEAFPREVEGPAGDGVRRQWTNSSPDYLHGYKH